MTVLKLIISQQQQKTKYESNKQKKKIIGHHLRRFLTKEENLYCSASAYKTKNLKLKKICHLFILECNWQCEIHRFPKQWILIFLLRPKCLNSEWLTAIYLSIFSMIEKFFKIIFNNLLKKNYFVEIKKIVSTLIHKWKIHETLFILGLPVNHYQKIKKLWISFM